MVGGGLREIRSSDELIIGFCFLAGFSRLGFCFLAGFSRLFLILLVNPH